MLGSADLTPLLRVKNLTYANFGFINLTRRGIMRRLEVDVEE